MRYRSAAWRMREFCVLSRVESQRDRRVLHQSTPEPWLRGISCDCGRCTFGEPTAKLGSAVELLVRCSRDRDRYRDALSVSSGGCCFRCHARVHGLDRQRASCRARLALGNISDPDSGVRARSKPRRSRARVRRPGRSASLREDRRHATRSRARCRVSSRV